MNDLDQLYRHIHGHSYAEALAARLPKQSPRTRQPQHEAAASSGMTATPLAQNPGPTLIGERVNSQGSRKVKQLLLADDYDSIVQIAVDQVENGAHMLDVCVAMTERADEKAQMQALVKKLSQAVAREGMTIVPLELYFNEKGRAKLRIALAQGKKLHDKREATAKRDWGRQKARLMREKG